MRKLLLQLFFASMLVVTSISTQAGGTDIGRKIDDFKLRDFRGKEHALSDVSSSLFRGGGVFGSGMPGSR